MNEDSEDSGEQLYYVQDTRQYVGNCVLWWGKDRAGYTCHLSRAGLYTAEECVGMRETDRAWPRELVERAASRMVDMQLLRELNEADAPMLEQNQSVRPSDQEIDAIIEKA